MSTYYPSGKKFNLQVSRQLLGWLAIFLSAFCFYLSTVIIRWGRGTVAIDSSYFVFARFFVGFIVVGTSLLWQRHWIRPVRYHYLVGRTVTNAIAVLCFFKSVELGSLAEANILNMTYPLFVTILSWFFLRGQRDAKTVAIVMVAMIGIWMVLFPEEFHFGVANMWGLCSGVTAAASMIYLNISRRYHDSETILFFMFGLGSLLIYLFFQQTIFMPNLLEFAYLFGCALSGIAGQYLLTFGFFYVTAVEGSIISSSRILLAAILGPLLVSDPSLTLAGWCGAMLIFAANVALALRRRG